MGKGTAFGVMGSTLGNIVGLLVLYEYTKDVKAIWAWLAIGGIMFGFSITSLFCV